MSDLIPGDVIETRSADELRFLMGVCLKQRYGEQVAFYTDRKNENEQNSSFTFMFSTFFMFCASLSAFINLSTGVPFWSLIATVLPSFASLLSSFDQIYDWERQAGLYRDAHDGLQDASLQYQSLEDNLNVVDLKESYQALARWLLESEKVLAAEADQWGQLTPGVRATTMLPTSTVSSPTKR